MGSSYYFRAKKSFEKDYLAPVVNEKLTQYDPFSISKQGRKGKSVRKMFSRYA